MTSEDVAALLRGSMSKHEFAIGRGLLESFNTAYGLRQDASNIEYVQYMQSNIHYAMLPLFISSIKMNTINDPHIMLTFLKETKELLQIHMPAVIHLFNNEFNSIMDEYHQQLQNIHKFTRSLHQKVQMCLYEQNYDEFLAVIIDYCKNYPMWPAGRKSVELVGKVLLYCEGELLHEIKFKHELCYFYVPEYNSTLRHYFKYFP